jgi:hypothetical protein
VSWDLDIVPREHEDDPFEWIESRTGEAHDAEAVLAHAAAIRARRPELELHGPAEDGSAELSMPEDSPFPLQVYLFGDHAGITVAYWDLGDQSPALADLLQDVVSALVDATGWVPYDPQEGRALELAELRGAFLGGHDEGVGLVKSLDAQPQAPPAPPKRKRFLGLF